MANVDAIVQEGIAAVKAGHRDEARRILVRATELDERNEQAWLWLSACVDSIDEQRICLENVLSINPANQKAQRGLDTLNKRQSAPPTPTVSPCSESGLNSNPYAGTGFDSNPYAGSSNDPAIGTGWSGFDTGNTDSAGAASSVEWANPDRAPAYGSGKNVQLPSSDEYDQWMSDLPLGGSSANGEPTTGYDPGFDPTSGPFSSSTPTFDDNGSAFDSAYDPFNTSGFGGSSPGGSGAFDAPAPGVSAQSSGDFGDSAPFDQPLDRGGDVFEAPFHRADDFGNDEIDLFSPSSQPPGVTDRYNGRSPAPSATPAPSAGDTPPERRSPSRAFDDSDLFGGPSTKPAEGRSTASSNPFGGKSNIFGDYATFSDHGPAEEPSGGPGTTFTFDNKVRKTSPYFASIPSDIQVQGGAKPNMRLLLTVGVLGLLNAISLGVLVLNLLNR